MIKADTFIHAVHIKITLSEIVNGQKVMGHKVTKIIKTCKALQEGSKIWIIMKNHIIKRGKKRKKTMVIELTL
jgi:fructose-specific phosphotransferase system component IIB